MTPQHPEGGRRRNTPAAALCHAPSRRTVPPVVTGGRRYGQPILTGSRHYGQPSLRAVVITGSRHYGQQSLRAAVVAGSHCCDGGSV